MRDIHLNVMRNAILARAAQEEPDATGPSFDNAFTSVVVRCVELGDVRALAYWTQDVRSKAAAHPIGNDEPIIGAAEYILGRWKIVEEVHGLGALMNYQQKLMHSPARHIGLTEIENATRFQLTRPRDIKDPTWSLEYC